MAIFHITSPDGAQYEVNAPDGATEQDAIAYAQSQHSAPPRSTPTGITPEAAGKPRFELPFGLGTVSTPPTESGFNLPAFTIAAGRRGDQLVQGLRQANRFFAGIGASPQQKAALEAEQAQQAAEMADKENRFAQLESVHPGSTFLGGSAPIAPLGPAALATTAAMSYGSPSERATGAGAVLVGNKAAQTLGKGATAQYQASAADAAQANAQNAVRNQTLAAAQSEGLRVPPSTVNPSFLNRRLESVAGKVATQQDISLGNAQLADAIAARELGLPPGTPLTEQATRAVRKQAYQQSYEPIAQAGQFQVSPQYGTALDAITAKNSNAAQSFPGAAATDVAALVDSYRPPNGTFDAAHALQATQILRDQAREAFRKGDNAVGQAKIAISREIENEIERQLSASGQQGTKLLQNFQQGRQLMAKSHSVEDAIRTGTGSVELPAFAAMTQRGTPLSSGLATLGNFANAFPKAAQKPAQIGSPGVSKLDAAMAAIMGPVGYGAGAASGLAFGGPVGAAVGAVAPLVVPPTVRALLLSRGYQGLMAQIPKQKAQGLLGSKALDNEMAPWIAGLLGYGATN